MTWLSKSRAKNWQKSSIITTVLIFIIVTINTAITIIIINILCVTLLFCKRVQMVFKEKKDQLVNVVRKVPRELLAPLVTKELMALRVN